MMNAGAFDLRIPKRHLRILRNLRHNRINAHLVPGLVPTNRPKQLPIVRIIKDMHADNFKVIRVNVWAGECVVLDDQDIVAAVD